jgi:hypothetical protein
MMKQGGSGGRGAAHFAPRTTPSQGGATGLANKESVAVREKVNGGAMNVEETGETTVFTVGESFDRQGVCADMR